MSDDKLIRDAQYRKGLSIGFFNATNSAIALIAASIMPSETDIHMLERVGKIRDILIEQHKEYYATNIASIGLNYNVEEAIKKLNDAKTIGELNIVWLRLSADERHNDEILKVAQKQKKELSK